jgi:hypothetical protein
MPRLQVDPSEISFGGVEIGSSSVPHDITITYLSNNLSVPPGNPGAAQPDGHAPDVEEAPIPNAKEDNPVWLTLAGTASPAARDFAVEGPPAPWQLNAGRELRLRVVFRPERLGSRKYDLSFGGDSNGFNLKTSIRLRGDALPPRRLRFVRVALNPKENLKKGEHYVLPVSNEVYLSELAANGLEVDWYAAIPTGTSDGAVSSRKASRPGQVKIESVETANACGCMAYCFDLQRISTKWLSSSYIPLTRMATIREVDAALSHAFGCRETPSCQFLKHHPPAPAAGRTTHAQGAIVLLPSARPDGREIHHVVLSPPGVSRIVSDCLDEQFATVLPAEKAEPDDQTSPYVVRTSEIPGIGSLWIPCYRATLRILEKARPTGQSLGETDLQQVLDRVRAYLGLEVPHGS